MKKTLYTIFFLAGCGVLASAVFAVDQVKTTDSFVYSSDVAVSAATSTTFTVYIGDSFTGVTAPAMKSLYFEVSGVYTGGAGTLTLDIDGLATTSLAFTLPVVSIPTPFEFIYKDPSDFISPTSPGSYTYTLNMTPSAVTIYGLGVKMSESHRYAPPACVDGASANQKMKTTDTLIFSSDIAVSSTNPQTATTTLYIGDNLAGVTAPAVKSLYFIVSGLYTGTAGTLALDIDSDVATLKTFSLPTVTIPTPFELIYIDPSNKINPTSAGTYTYTLNMTPGGGATIYGLSAKMSETHQYAPPSCGGIPILGDLISAVFDSTGSTDGGGYNSVMWTGLRGGPSADQGKVRFQFAGADSPAGPWSYIGGATCAVGDWFDPGSANTPIELIGTGVDAGVCRTAWNNKRYFRYKVEICSNDCNTAGEFTPTVNNVIVNWTP